MAQPLKKKPDVVHRSKLFGGRETAQEVHRKLAWGPNARCYRCGSKHVTIELSYHQNPFDLAMHEPRIAAVLIEESETKQLPIWQSKYGPMVRYWVEHTCGHCQRDVEREAAKLPSYVLVEIDRGVGQDKAVSQVPRSYRPKVRET